MAKVRNYNRVHDAGEHIINEANGRISREQIMIAATALATPMLAGTVLGRVTATGVYVPLNPAASDGSEVARGFLYERRELKKAGANVRAVVHVRDCEINGRKIFWPAGITAPQKTAAETALATNGVIVRY